LFGPGGKSVVARERSFPNWQQPRRLLRPREEK
jgi:hypothetical protein